MGRETGISSTDATFNPSGVAPKSVRDAITATLKHSTNAMEESIWGKGAPRRSFGENHWNQLFKWQREAKDAGTSIKAFCASVADVMDDEAPAGELQRLYDHINECPDLIFQLLTKRPHRFAERLPAKGFRYGNVWLGATCENQQFYDVRWPILYRAASALGLVSWIIYEPTIGPLSMRRGSTTPDWIIFGGESGPDSKRRPMEMSWAENLRDECISSGTLFFMKQTSARTPKEAKALIPVDMLINQSLSTTSQILRPVETSD